ncbi:dihydrolipoyl dehydrogenase [Gudongella sp. DL1XJH-153]|uniref:dihydrolipoyl dehydrogenase n=1 Tax=Gudongella sp. DL1XJH-153 TaxID=3409804 RepID=UPI003BB71794
MKIVIIGGGPGGYVAAVKAAQMGAQVVVVEKEYIGGTCLNTGCIPTKVLLHSTDIYHKLKNEAGSLGLELDNLEVNWNELQTRKELVATQLVEGVKNLLRTGNIEVIEGIARFTSKKSIEVALNDGGTKRVSFDRAIVATGAKPIIIPVPGHDLEGVITSREAMSLAEIPESLCIIGGGVIGMEFANIYSNLGCKVTIVEMLPDLVANMDQEIVESLEEALVDNGVQIHKSSKVLKIEMADGGLQVTAQKGNETFKLVADKVLMATGRKPAGDDLGLQEIGAKVERGAIQVDKLFKTDVDNIYAIGDCTGGVQLAHVASASGLMVAELIMGKRMAMDFRTIPYCVYTKPELASVGMTEKEALDKGYRIKVGRFPMYGNGKAVISGDVRGLVKILADEKTGEVLGIHIAGNSATELISAGAVAIRLEATVDELLTTIYAHPTVGESIHEAAEGVFGKAVHLPG